MGKIPNRKVSFKNNVVKRSYQVPKIWMTLWWSLGFVHNAQFLYELKHTWGIRGYHETKSRSGQRMTHLHLGGNKNHKYSKTEKLFGPSHMNAFLFLYKTRASFCRISSHITTCILLTVLFTRDKVLKNLKIVVHQANIPPCGASIPYGCQFVSWLLTFQSSSLLTAWDRQMAALVITALGERTSRRKTSLTVL